MKPMVYRERQERETEALAQGKYRGFDYIILGHGTHPTAYVRVPKTHRFYAKDYDDINIDVHGGLTYADTTVELADKTGWWIGWDYAHFGDFTGYSMMWEQERHDKKWSTEEIYEHVKYVVKQLEVTK